MNAFTRAYFEAALWSSTDDDEQPLDKNYGIEDFHPKVRKALEDEAKEFEDDNSDDIGDRADQAGHDFWLTRNGHGAGFWDGDWPEPAATRLTKASEAYGGVDLYVGDDGKLYAGGYERGRTRFPNREGLGDDRGGGIERERRGGERAADALELHIDNTRALYNSWKKIAARLIYHAKRGKYSPRLGVQAFEHLIEEGARSWAREYEGMGPDEETSGPWFKIFPRPVRIELAERYARDFEQKFATGELDWLAPRSFLSPRR